MLCALFTLPSPYADAMIWQDEVPPPPSTTLALAGEMDLRRLVDLAAGHLRIRIDYDPKLLAGSVTLRSQGGLTDEELWDLTNQLLATRGLVTIRGQTGSQVSIVKLSDAPSLARLEPPPIHSHWSPGLPHASFVVARVPLQHADPASLARTLAAQGPRANNAISVAPDGSLILADMRHRVAPLIELIGTLDVPSVAEHLVQIEARHLPASQLATLAQDVAARMNQLGGASLGGSVIAAPDGRHLLIIAASPDAARWKRLIDQLDQREPVHSRAYPVRWHTLRDVATLIESTILGDDPLGTTDDRERVKLDTLSGTLVVVATSRHHDMIESLLGRLEVASDESRRPMRLYEIRNRSAQDVLSLLRQVLAVEGIDQQQNLGSVADAPLMPSAAEPSRGPGAPPAPSPFAGAARTTPGTALGAAAGHDASGLVLTVDNSTNTLIAIGEPRQLERIDALLPMLDRRQAQVELEILMISMTESETLDLGAEIEYLAKLQSTSVSLSSLFGLSTLASGVRTATGIGGTALILDPGDYAVVVRALQTINRGRSLSVPKLLAGNNSPATINSVLQQPFTSTNASSTVATTSFAGTQDAGTNVTITPTIAAGDHLVLDYRVSVSSFVGDSSAPGIPPPRQQNSVSGSVTIPDGHTIAIGGIRLSTDGKSVSQVPLLAQLPLLGEAFKNRSRNTSESRFYVFIRANILRHDGFEDLKLSSERQLGAHELSDDFPTVAPRVIP